MDVRPQGASSLAAMAYVSAEARQELLDTLNEFLLSLLPLWRYTARHWPRVMSAPSSSSPTVSDP